jgi:predicted alpha/beta superfamily hydrolase
MLENAASEAATKTSAVEVPWSSQFDMTSQISGRTYRVYVFQPPVPPPSGGYPVLTVLDGNMTFPIAAALAATYAWSMCPALVVGVGYASADPTEWVSSRIRDLTPETPPEGIPQRPWAPTLAPDAVGGADDFHRFLVEELRPVIAGSHQVDPNRQTLFGYSLAGLFTLHVLLNHPGAYRSFVAASPSIWWNDRAVLAGERAFAEAVGRGEAAPRVLISVGAREQTLSLRPTPGMSPEDAEAQLAEARMVDNAWELGTRLSKITGEGYAACFHAFEDEDHLTGLAASVGRALDFATRD